MACRPRNPVFWKNRVSEIPDVHSIFIRPTMAQTHQELFQKLASLSQTFPNLGTRLSLAAAELKTNGTPPSQSLLQELNAYCQNFAHLRDRGRELAKASPTAGDFSEITSLLDLENLLKASKSSTGDIHQKALTILEGVTAIAHQDDPNFPPLKPVKAKAQELQQAISNSPPGQLHPEAKALAEETHPLAALLTLVEEQQDLDDDRWLALEEKVGPSFGKKLVVAISRGKLKVSKTTLPPSSKPPAAAIKLPSLEELEKPEVPVTPPTQKPTQELPPLIVVPPGGATPTARATQVPDVMILEDPSSSEDQDEPIILPGIELSNTVRGENNAFGQQGEVSVGLKVLVHLQGIGDRSFGAYEYAGTRGQGLRIEAFQINLDPPRNDLSIQYMAHISSIGDTAWLDEGTLTGERGRSFRIEGFAMRLTGGEASKYDVFYTAHIQNMGDSAVYSNGQYCGTRGKFLRVEGLKVWIQQKPNG